MSDDVTPEDWLTCPECGSGDVAIAVDPYSEYRNYIECRECGEGGYFENHVSMHELFTQNAEVGSE